MSVDYTTTALVSKIKRKALMPTNQNLLTDDDLIALLDDELHSYIVPLVMKAQEEYFVASEDVSVVSGTATYEIPSRAIGKKLRAIGTVDTSGLLTRMPHLSIEDIMSDTDYSALCGYYVQKDSVVLYPTPTSSYTLRLYYFDRPGVLTATTNCAKVLSVNTGTNEVTCEWVPSSWTILTKLDVISGDPSFQTKNQSTASTNVAGYVLTMPAAVVATIEAGDWIAEEHFSPLPQIPAEAIDLLVQSSTVKALEALGGQEQVAALAVGKLQKMEEHVICLLEPRVEAQPHKIVARNNWEM